VYPRIVDARQACPQPRRVLYWLSYGTRRTGTVPRTDGEGL